MSIASWDAIASVLASEYRLVRCHFRDLLHSTPTFPSGLNERASAVVELLDCLATARVIVDVPSFYGHGTSSIRASLG